MSEEDKPVVEVVPDEPEVEGVGAWQSVLSVVMTGDLSKIDEDKAHEKLIIKMNLLVAEMRDLFPGRIEVATVTPWIFSAQEDEI